ncbi:MAG: L-threonylcarbamoyladenylate synthase [Patescibacteria group bacterium]
MLILKECNLSEIVVELLNGKIVVFPTETSYGLGCDATNQQAVDKIFKIKERKSDKPLLVVAPTVEMVKKYLVWDDLVERLARAYWPGSLTIVGVVKNDCGLADGVISKDGTLALRVTNHPIPKFLSEKLGKPVVATSANISDAGDSYNAEEIAKVFADKENQPDIILNYGELPRNPSTTIVSVMNNELKILRQGELKIN